MSPSRRRFKSDTPYSGRGVSFVSADATASSLPPSSPLSPLPNSPFLLPRLSLPVPLIPPREVKPTCVNPDPCTCASTSTPPISPSLDTSTHVTPLSPILSREARKSVVTWDKRNSWFRQEASWEPCPSPPHTKLTIRLLNVALPLLAIVAIALLMSEIGLTFVLLVTDILPPEVHLMPAWSDQIDLRLICSAQLLPNCQLPSSTLGSGRLPSYYFHFRQVISSSSKVQPMSNIEQGHIWIYTISVINIISIVAGIRGPQTSPKPCQSVSY